MSKSDYNIKTAEISYYPGDSSSRKKKRTNIIKEIGFVDNTKELTRYMIGYATFRHWCPLVAIPDNVDREYDNWWDQRREAREQQKIQHQEVVRKFQDEKREKLFIKGSAAVRNVIFHNYLGLAWNGLSIVKTLSEAEPQLQYYLSQHGPFKVMQSFQYNYHHQPMRYEGFEGKRRILSFERGWDEEYRTHKLKQSTYRDTNIIRCVLNGIDHKLGLTPKKMMRRLLQI